jgi:hypothetical protein
MSFLLFAQTVFSFYPYVTCDDGIQRGSGRKE